MTALAPGAALDPQAAPFADPSGLRLPPTSEPRPDAVRASDHGPCQVIELFPGVLASRPDVGMQPEPCGWDDHSDESTARRPHGGLDRAAQSARMARRRLAIRLQLLRLWVAGRAAGQQGMATAEYAIATLGAVAFAGLLVVIMRSDEVRGFLLGIIRAALALP